MPFILRPSTYSLYSHGSTEREPWLTWLDRRAGKLSSLQRSEDVDDLKKDLSAHPPLKIEIPDTSNPKSSRILKEKQAPLFSELPDSSLPPLYLLDEPKVDVELLSNETLEFTSRLIERRLQEFGVEVKVVSAHPGPVITRYKIEPATGVKGNQIINLVKDLARALSVASIRVVETIPGKTTMGLEIPNPKRQVVRLHEILSSRAYADMVSPLTIALGKDISGLDALSAIMACHPDVAVIFVTSHAERETVSSAIRGGARGYILKPFSLDNVRNGVHQARVL